MKSLFRIIAIVIGICIILPFIYLVFIFFYAQYTAYPSDIVAFSPKTFPAVTDAKFFYSIGDELRYANQITQDSPALLHEKISQFLVSPDGNKIAVVAEGQLKIVSGDGSAIRAVAAVDSIYKKPKPIGEIFFRDNHFQWSEDEKFLYLIKDEYYQSKGSQLFSDNGEIWKYELATGSLSLVIKPFKAFEYFFGVDNGIYYSIPDDSGSLQLKHFNGSESRNISRAGKLIIPKEMIAPDTLTSIFYSFSVPDYQNDILPKKGVKFTLSASRDQMDVLISDKKFLTVKVGQGIKGAYFCVDTSRGVFLPGGQFYLLNASCGNVDGQLLLNIVTGDYMSMPKDLRVYVTENTQTFPDFIVAGSGIELRRPLPEYILRDQ